MKTEMDAAVLYGVEDLRLERLPAPVPGTGEVVLRVEAALTCGTDLKVYRRGYHARMLAPPIPFGHEVAGVVHAVGLGVHGFSRGDRAVPLNSAPCGECFWCEHGQENLCDDLLFLNGAYAEYLLVPARIVAKNMLCVPDAVALEHAALTEPLACVLRGLEESAVKAGDSLAVIGAGPIGLLFVHAAALAGAEVIAVVKRDDQEEAALRLGAKHIVRSSVLDVVAAVRALTPGARGVDVAMEAVATPATWQLAVHLPRRGGVVNFFGGPPKGTVVDLDTNLLHYNDLTLKASFHHTPATARRAFALISSGRFLAAEFITGRAALNDIAEVYRAMHVGSLRSIKTAIIP